MASIHSSSGSAYYTRTSDTYTSSTCAKIWPSQMKPSLKLTKEMWAVSMVVENKPFSFHTMLLIETIQENGKRQNFKAHLMGFSSCREIERDGYGEARSSRFCYTSVARVDITELPTKLDPSRYRANYDTWELSSDKVNVMLKKIRKEKEDPSEITRPFHILGENSIFSPSHVEFDINDKDLLEMREKEPKKFEELYKLYETMEKGTDVPIKFPFIKAGAWIASKPGNLFIEGQKENHLSKMIGGGIGLAAVLPITTSLTILGIFIDMPRLLFDLAKSKKNKELFELFGKHVQKLNTASQNCFNWARAKLRMVGVPLDPRAYEWIAPIPTLYLPKQERKAH